MHARSARDLQGYFFDVLLCSTRGSERVQEAFATRSEGHAYTVCDFANHAYVAGVVDHKTDEDLWLIRLAMQLACDIRLDVLELLSGSPDLAGERNVDSALGTHHLGGEGRHVRDRREC